MVKNQIICIYHYPCNDGWASAYAFNDFYKNELKLRQNTNIFKIYNNCDLLLNENIHIEYIGMEYKNNKPEILDIYKNIFKDKIIFILDFSFSYEILKEICNIAKFVFIIDHHIGVFNDLYNKVLLLNYNDYINFINNGNIKDKQEEKFEKLLLLAFHTLDESNIINLLESNIIINHNSKIKNCLYIYDNDHSGSVLTWKILNSDYNFYRLVPEILLNIEHRDLGRFNANSNVMKVFTALKDIRLDTSTFKILDDCINNLDEYNNLLNKGTILLDNYKLQVQKFLSLAVKVKMLDEYIIPIANVHTMFSSEVAHELAINYPFAVCYHDYYDTDIKMLCRKLDFRSEKNTGIDVSIVAKKIEGGGHKNSSGARIFAKNYEELGEKFNSIFTIIEDQNI